MTSARSARDGAAGASTSGIRLGVNPIGWSNDDLRKLGAHIALETCLVEARAAGYEGIELGHKFPRDAAALKACLQPHQLALISGWYGTHLLERDVSDEWDAMAPHLELLSALGCEVMVVAEVTGCIHGHKGQPLSARATLNVAQWRQLCSRLGELARAMQARGIRLAYHHHMGTVVQTQQELERLLDQTPDAVGLVLDTGHLAYAGGDALQVLRAYAARIVHVHCKDVRRPVLADVLAVDSSFLDAVVRGVFTTPGDGSLAFEPLVEALVRNDYAGWLVVEAEQDPDQANPYQYALAGRKHLCACLLSALRTKA